MQKKIDHKKIFFGIVLFAAAIFMARHFLWQTDNLIFFLIFVALILHPISSRITAGAAILLLAITAFLPAFGKNDYSEITVIWAYYLMILTLLMFVFAANGDKPEKLD